MLKDNRMKEIYALVREMTDRGACDVGTDHAHIPIELVSTGKLPFAIATDISLPSAKKGEKNVAENGLSDKIKTYCANGTLGVPLDGIGDIIIAGMGGELIAEIIFADERLKSPDLHFVLQPMTKQEELRVLLSENGYEIEKESCVSDGERIYFIMSVYYTGVPKTLSVRERLLGVNTVASPTLLKYTNELKGRLSVRLRGIRSATVPDAEEEKRLTEELSVLDAFTKAAKNEIFATE